MYLLYCLIALIFVYFAPALSLFPQLISSSGLAASIPIVSLFIIGCVAKLLIHINYFTQPAVISVSAILLIISVIRLKFYISTHEMSWPKNQLIMLIFCSILLLPVFITMGTDSFSSHDEIYSWNMWAVQFFKGESTVDFYYTQSPYPLLFSIVIAYCYKLFGNMELHMPVRCMLAIFPLCMAIAVSTSSENKNATQIVLSGITLLFMLYGLEIQRKVSVGLADPVMAAALVVSVRNYIDFEKSDNNLLLIWISLICALTAAYTKQPALIWSTIALPLVMIQSKQMKKYPKNLLTILFISVIASLAWIFGEGAGFTSNSGVVTRSLGNRNIIEQTLYALTQYVVHKPLIIITVIAAGFSVFKLKIFRGLYLFLILPSLIAWFLFGAYDLRLGIHVVALSILLICCLDYPIPFFNEKSRLWVHSGIFFESHYKKIGLILFIVVSLLSTQKVIKTIGNKSFAPYHGGKHTIYKYFGDMSDYVYSQLYDNPNITLWIPSNYIYGIFYGHTNIVRPKFIHGQSYGKKDLIKELINETPDYLFDGGSVGYGPATSILREVVIENPSFFNEIKFNTRPKYNYKLYQLNKKELLAQKKDIFDDR